MGTVQREGRHSIGERSEFFIKRSSPTVVIEVDAHFGQQRYRTEPQVAPGGQVHIPWRSVEQVKLTPGSFRQADLAIEERKQRSREADGGVMFHHRCARSVKLM
jgi:hypothetical protein